MADPPASDTCVIDKTLERGFAAAALRELAEQLEVETFAIDLGDAHLSDRTQVRRATTYLELCPLADDQECIGRSQDASLLARAGA